MGRSTKKKRVPNVPVKAQRVAVDDSIRSTKTYFFWSIPLVVFAAVAVRIGPALHQSSIDRFEVGGNRTAHINAERPNYSLCDDLALSHFLHQDPVEGFHIVCFQNIDDGTVLMEIFQGAQIRNNIDTRNLDGTTEMLWSDLKWHVKNGLSLCDADELHQSWAAFTALGERLVGENDPVVDATKDKQIANRILDAGMVLIFEGGQWLWPGVRIGFKRLVDLSTFLPKDVNPMKNVDDLQMATLETLSLQPLVLSVKGFLSGEECEYIKEKAIPRLSYSGVVMTDKHKDRPVSDFRTSQSTFLVAHDDILRGIDARTASLVRIPRSHQEHVQIVRYGISEKYNAHHDWFNASLFRNDPSTLRVIEHGRKNRLATVLWYLSDVEEGGETVFPRINGAPHPKNLSDCSRGLKVQPQVGKVIIFYSFKANGEGDPLSLHAACAVKKGVKFAANKWVWNDALHYIK